MQFDLPKEKSSIIKVIGVGGGGSNAVNYMFNQGITGVNFVICNTDAQALELSPVPNKIQLGPHLTEGRGAGSMPTVGMKATEESIEEIKEILEVNTKMVFVTAGMGGGTGTGGAPVVAKAAREMGILTVGIVTEPFVFEGRRRQNQALEGIAALKENVDTLIVISNEKMRQMFGNMKLSEAFAKADNILLTAAKGIAEIITVPGYINVDFEDVKTVMTSSGVAIMGSAVADGEYRAMRAVEQALSSPLLSDNDIRGAKHILLNITSGTEEVLMDEIAQITDYVQEEAGHGTDIIWGNCFDESLGDKLSVTVIATGFETDRERKKKEEGHVKVKIYDLGDDERKKEEKRKQKEEADANEAEAKRMEAERLRKETEAKAQAEAEAAREKDRFREEFTAEEQQEEPVEQKRDLYSFEFEINQVSGEAEYNDIENYDELSNVTIDEDHYSGVRFEEDEEENEPMEMELKTRQPEANKEEPTEKWVIREVKTDADAEEEERMKAKKQLNEQSERVKRLKNLSMKFRNPNSLQELESEPAYKRRNIDLDDVPHSSENNVSRYTLSEKKEDDDRFEIRRNNSFLHDNVD